MLYIYVNTCVCLCTYTTQDWLVVDSNVPPSRCTASSKRATALRKGPNPVDHIKKLDTHTHLAAGGMPNDDEGSREFLTVSTCEKRLAWKAGVDVKFVTDKSFLLF